MLVKLYNQIRPFFCLLITLITLSTTNISLALGVKSNTNFYQQCSIEKPWHSCFGTKLLANGAKYQGGFLNDRPHFFGIISYLDGTIFQGKFNFGLVQGNGSFSYPSGDHFSGVFKDSKLNGSGIHTLSDGRLVTSEYRDDIVVGISEVHMPKKWKYYGPINKNFLLHGNGILHVFNKYKYIGEFFQGKFHGKGTIFYNSGEASKGYWLNGQLIDEYLIN